MANILCMADLHGRLPKIPKSITESEIDILVFAGDICGHFNKNWDFKGPKRRVDQAAEAIDQKDWIINTLKPWVDKTLKPKSVIWVNGNHDFASAEGVGFDHTLFTGSKTITIDGIKIGLLAGSGELFGEWNDEINESEFANRIDKIDRDIRVLISHCPPYGILDRASDGNRIGSMSLTQAIFGRLGEIPYFTHLTHSIYGHCHELSGQSETHDVDGRQVGFYNVAENYKTLELS